MHPSKEGGGFQGIIASDGSATAEGATSEGVISRKRRGFGGRRGGKRRRYTSIFVFSVHIEYAL